jgi:hypothetical protein
MGGLWIWNRCGGYDVSLKGERDIPHGGVDGAGAGAEVCFGAGVAAGGRGVYVAGVGEVDIAVGPCGCAGAAFAKSVSN